MKDGENEGGWVRFKTTGNEWQRRAPEDPARARPARPGPGDHQGDHLPGGDGERGGDDIGEYGPHLIDQGPYSIPSCWPPTLRSPTGTLTRYLLYSHPTCSVTSRTDQH